MWDTKTITVVMPAYNEEPNIERAVREFSSISNSDGKKLVDEILVIDNNSKDKTAPLAKQAGARVVTETKQGYGNALKRGLVEAQNDLIILVEPDGTFVAKDLFKLLAYSSDFDLVCGTRTTRELLWEEANMGWFLRYGNVIVAKMIQILYGTCSLSDCGCTFRLIHRDKARLIVPELSVGASHFLPNMIIAARMHKLSLIEIPLTYRGRVGESKITGTLKGTFKTGFNMIFLALGSWPNYLKKLLSH